MQNPRQTAFFALREVHRRGAFADAALDRAFRNSQLNDLDRRLVTELVCGSVRRTRSLDFIIDKLATKKSSQQPPELRTILHLGLYQLEYLNQIPPSAAVNTTVKLAKENGFSGLSSFVNGLLRQYIRLTDSNLNPLTVTNYKSTVERLGISHSFPDWIVEFWLENIGETETELLCEWFNQSPTIDLRINPLKSSIDKIETAFKARNISTNRIPNLPQALRLNSSTGAIQNLPGYSEGWWTVQDSSAQLVTHLLGPQPGEIIIDACAAPGGKTTHSAELMQDEGTIYACDKTANRLKKLTENAGRLQMKSIKIHTGDSRHFPEFINLADRVLLDAPCSGLGTLHRRADARWQHTPENIQQQSQLQSELLANTATFVKSGGVLVYATCTIHPLENEQVVRSFLNNNPHWQIEPPTIDLPVQPSPEGWVKIWPHQHQMDGFFMVRLKRN
ncbi:16S rRNA (cytosine(967)-C(5))-methyltransferase [Microcoleus sp. LEGE 07076]|uniref:16S rRNA (cytosine(967)-C(5))-methyltransferase n=1 Tax=Microcoleus sp. LEGE 07076 TaxID=915322 RepID=UPI00187E535C|nr:16S rRNA (cytosine(967)-C(5))-methyltransferase [Microcoleus sp. LEGE 07076]MBE9183751.1 16S rRNA (cytosine(967)-C(5))-methyltransferase [Microcoleus sp. LEGE 07076]